MLSHVINSVCTGKLWQTITRLSIDIGRGIPSARTICWSDVRSLLIIYSHYCLWMLKHVLSFCIISRFFSSIVRVFPRMSSTTNRGMSCFAIFSRYVISTNLSKCACPHLSVFLSFLLYFWSFLDTSSTQNQLCPQT